MSDAVTTYRGRCHCGRIRFELDARLDHVVECNCSICRRRGALWHGASEAQLRVQAEDGALMPYRFGTRTANHWFCRHCGVTPFVRPRLDPSKWAVNVRCLDDVDLRRLPVVPFDGEHWEAAAAVFLAARRRAPAPA